MIKFALRRNLIYPLQLTIYNLLRKFETILLKFLFNFNDSLLYTPLMFLGEFISGLIIYLYQNNFLKQKKSQDKYFLMKFKKYIITSPDNKVKIYALIIFCAFFDWIQFMIWTVEIPFFINISESLVTRLSGITTIIDALFYFFILRLPIFRHHLFSLIIIGICLIIIIISEFFFQEINIFLPYSSFINVLFLILFCHSLAAIMDSIEKYLYEYDFLNPYYVLMLEGLSGFFMSFSYFIYPDYLKDIKIVLKNFDTGKKVFFIFLLFLYTILCGFRNIYRVITNKIYSPMARSLTDYFLNPIYLIIYFFYKNDFLLNQKRNIAHFIINIILSILISICGCVYNEFMILFFCGLEYNTYDQIAKRANILNELIEINDLNNNEEN